MRPRLPIRRILFLRPFRPPNSTRPFTRNTLPDSRPHIPYLSSPILRHPTARFLTTETKKWLKDEVKKGIKYSVYIYTFAGLVIIMAYGAHLGLSERKYHPPPEWSWTGRSRYMAARSAEDEHIHSFIDWATVGSYYRLLVERLEDPQTDGAELLDQDEGGIFVEGIGKTGFDISNKSEPWRRGYYEALMGTARAAERLDDCVKDRKRNIVFPKNVVLGPSNPYPRPIPPGAATAPQEQDCEKAFEDPDVYYMRVLTTRGFTEKQRVDAALAYGAWLDYKGTPETAMEMYKWGLDIAMSGSASAKTAIDPSTGVLKLNAEPPSTNVLSAATALAVHHALGSNISLALPILLSILRARRSLPDPQPTTEVPEQNIGIMGKISSLAKSVFVFPPHPPAPPDGTAPPERTLKERCEEAGIITNIGEILYASKPSKSSREDGLAWTREAVDIAEEQLRRQKLDAVSMKRCQQCLGVALENWDKMVAKLAQEERDIKTQGGKTTSWFGFGGEEEKDSVGRWESEEDVVRERRRRAFDLLEAKPKLPWTSSLSV